MLLRLPDLELSQDGTLRIEKTPHAVRLTKSEVADGGLNP